MIFNFVQKEKSKQIAIEVNKANKLQRYLIFIFGVLISAIAFNLFLKPNHLISGVSGLSIITEKLLKIDPSLLILMANIILLIASLVFLGKEKTKNTALGSILYPLFIKITDWIPDYVDFGNTEILVITLTGAVLSGFGSGLILKNNFTTGGSDVLKQILSKYGKMQFSKANLIAEGPIIMCGALVYGWQSFLYSIITIYVVGYISDRVILGISEYKNMQIITSKEKDVKDFIITNLNQGLTILDVKGGYTSSKLSMLICAIPTRDYFMATEGIKKIDPDAFIIVTDTYEIKRKKWKYGLNKNE